MTDYKCKMVLLVDDNPIDNLINKKIIQNNCFAKEIKTFTSAKAALQFLKNNINKESFGNHLGEIVIFLDIRMPEMDGFQFLEEYQNLNENILGICKIYMLSSTLDPLDKKRISQNKHIHKFFSKPLSNKFVEEIPNGEM